MNITAKVASIALSASLLVACGSAVPSGPTPPPALSDAAYVWCKANSDKVVNAAITLGIVSRAGSVSDLAIIQRWDAAKSTLVAKWLEMAPACLAAFEGR